MSHDSSDDQSTEELIKSISERYDSDDTQGLKEVLMKEKELDQQDLIRILDMIDDNPEILEKIKRILEKTQPEQSKLSKIANIFDSTRKVAVFAIFVVTGGAVFLG